MYSEVWFAFQLSLEVWVSLSPYHSVEFNYVLLWCGYFFAYWFISSVCIITVTGSFSSSVDISVFIGVFSTVSGYFTPCTRAMIYYVFWNSSSTYCFSFLLNFLNWYFSSLCLDVVPKTVPKFSTLPLKFLINGVCAVQLKCMLCPPRPW